MNAGVLTAPQVATLDTVPTPTPAPGEVLVRIEGCGVCGSDLPAWEGRPWFRYPREPGAPGHEGWGTVERLGAGVCRPAVGTRVAGLLYRAYAEYDLADAAQLVPLPPELALEPFPGEPLACAINVFRRSGIRCGDVVAVVGVGFLGAIVTQLAARAGAQVVAVSRRTSALRAATLVGAGGVVELATDVVERVTEFNGGALCDVAVEAAGKQATLDVAASLTRERGRLVIAGFHQDGPRQVDMQMWNWRGLDVISAHERDPRRYVDAMREAAAAVAEGRLDPGPLYTHRFPLARIADAFDSALTRPEGFMKALVHP
jgi:threonine dehydrogenase-like Zn-dependent dehydrogenase